MKTLSLIVPVYNEEENIEKFINEVEKNILDKIDYEIIFCLDPSIDKSLEILLSCKKKYKNIKIILLSRRFGQSLAIKSGLHNCNSKYILVIDVDFQDPPELISQMYEKIKDSDYESIYAQRTSREGETKIRKVLVGLYYYLMNGFSDQNIFIPKNVGECRIFTKKFVDKLIELDRGNFLRGDSPYLGFKQAAIKFDRKPRHGGKSKYTIGSIKGAIIGLLNFSYFFLIISMIGSVLSFIFGLFSLIYGLDVKFFIFFALITIMFIGFVIMLYVKSVFNKVHGADKYVIDKIYD